MSPCPVGFARPECSQDRVPHAWGVCAARWCITGDGLLGGMGLCQVPEGLGVVGRCEGLSGCTESLTHSWLFYSQSCLRKSGHILFPSQRKVQIKDCWSGLVCYCVFTCLCIVYRLHLFPLWHSLAHSNNLTFDIVCTKNKPYHA